MKLKKILVTTDFSDLSRQAFPVATGIARKFHSELHLVHVLESMPPLVFFSPEGVQGYSPHLDYRSKFADLLARTAEEEPAFQGISVKPHLLEGGYVHERLAGFQRQHGIDLTVVSTHGRTGLGHLILGSFAEKVVRLAACPVLTYRPPPGLPPLKAEGGRREDGFGPRKILVPYDFSVNAEVVLDAVRTFAPAYGARVLLQHVVEPLPDLALIPREGVTGEELGERRVDALEKARRELEGLIQREFPDLPGQAVAGFGAPFAEIIRMARESEADLIIMATHGWTGLKHMILGSVAEKVVRKAPCPVLTLRPAGLSFEHP